MRIGIDIREACTEKRTGKGQWTFGLVEELLRRESPLMLFTHTSMPLTWNRTHVEEVLIPHTGLRWHRQAASLLTQTSHVDVYLSPTSYIVPFLLGKRFPYVPVIHDLIAFRREPHDRKALFIERLTLPRTLRNARHVLTVSQSTTDDLLKRFPSLSEQAITPVFAGPSSVRPKPASPQADAIVCIATLCPRKNQRRLIQAYAQLPLSLRARHPLLLAGGRGWQDHDILSMIKSTPGVTWNGYVGSAEYEALLHRAAVFAFPSLYEGFGLPVLDALQRGCTVVTSDRGSLQEVAGEAALLVDPTSVTSIAAGLTRALTDHALRARLRQDGPVQAKTFSWGRTADLVLEKMRNANS